MEKRLFTSESVTEGHPDKICDAVSDAVLDALMEQDLHTEDLSAVALDGQALVKTLCSKTSLYNRALERQANKENGK